MSFTFPPLPGAIKTLFLMLSNAPSLRNRGITVFVGEEYIRAQDGTTPMIVLVPNGGRWVDGPGYAKNFDPDIEMIWSTREQIELWLWAVSPDAPNKTVADDYDAVETLRMYTLQAMQYQRAPGGLFYKPTEGRWSRASDAINRLGRSYILTCEVEMAVTDVAPVIADVDEVDIIPSIVS